MEAVLANLLHGLALRHVDVVDDTEVELIEHSRLDLVEELLDGGAALKRERDAARDVLREAAGRMAATDDELREVLGEDVWPKNE